MAPILYMIPGSPPVRAVLMCAKALGVELTFKEVNVLKMEHLTPEFLQINPQHTVPTLDDDGFIIWESHAIMPYLISKYGKNDDLYPTDFKKRAVVDQRLHYDNSGLFTICLRAIMYPIIFSNQTVIEPTNVEKVKEAYGFLEIFLANNKWIAGDSLTIADYSIYTTVSSLNVLVPIEEKFPKLLKWLKNMDVLPESEPNRVGLEAFHNFVKSRLES